MSGPIPSRRALIALAPAAVIVGAVPAFGLPKAAADPVFAIIAEHRRLQAAIDIIPIDDDGPVYDAACDAEEACLQGLANALPTTLAGAAAMLAHMLEREAGHVGESVTGSPFERAVRQVIVALRAMDPAR